MQLSHEHERGWLMILCQLQQNRIATMLAKPRTAHVAVHTIGERHAKAH